MTFPSQRELEGGEGVKDDVYFFVRVGYVDWGLLWSQLQKSTWKHQLRTVNREHNLVSTKLSLNFIQLRSSVSD